MTLQDAPIVKAQMLIHKQVAEIFEAFVDPAITTKILVHQEQRDFRGSDDEVLAKAIDSKGGFTIVLAGSRRCSSTAWP